MWADHIGRTDITFVSLSTGLLATAAGDSMPRGPVELKTLLVIEDEQIRALGSLLERETRTGCPTGRLYGESIGMALAAHLIRRYAVFPPRTVEYRGGLSKDRLRRIVDYITANLVEDTWSAEIGAPGRHESFSFLSIIQAEHWFISAPVHT